MPGGGMMSPWRGKVKPPKADTLSTRFGWRAERCCDRVDHDAWYVMHNVHIAEVFHDETAARARASFLFSTAAPGPSAVSRKADEHRQYGMNRG